MLQMVCVTDVLNSTLINDGEALAKMLFLKWESEICEHYSSQAAEARMSSLNAIQLGAFCWVLGENHQRNNLNVYTSLKLRVRNQELWVQPRDAYQFFSHMDNFIVSVASNHESGQWKSIFLQFWRQYYLLFKSSGARHSWLLLPNNHFLSCWPCVSGFPSPGLWFLSVKWGW